jgi:hypothetical protein
LPLVEVPVTGAPPLVPVVVVLPGFVPVVAGVDVVPLPVPVFVGFGPVAVVVVPVAVVDVVFVGVVGVFFVVVGIDWVDPFWQSGAAFAANAELACFRLLVSVASTEEGRFETALSKF